MTGRERILATLNRKPVDRIPYDMSGTDCSGIHVIPYKNLRRHFGLSESPIPCGCLIQLIAEFDAPMRTALGVDAEALSFGSKSTKIWKAPFGVNLEVPALFAVEDQPDGSSIVKNAKGQIYSHRAAGAVYFDPVGTPLAGITTPQELSSFSDLFERWDYPSVYDESVEALARRARHQYEATDRAVIALWRLHYLQSGQIMRGYEQFLVDLMTDPTLTHALLSKLHEVYLRRVDLFMNAFGDAFDAVFLTDDLGTQESGLVSPAIYKEMLYPYVAELVARIKARGKKVIMHSCGAVAEFIPFMIDMGIDAVNPVQVSARGMNPADLVREFGRDIAFWGGGCDTQHALNAGDPAVVRKEVERRFREFGSKASWVFTQVHNIQYDVPIRNILELQNAYQKAIR